MKLVASWRVAAIASVTMLAACSNWLGPRTVNISTEEITTKLAKQFPITRQVMNMMDLTALPPRLQMQSEQNRVAATFDLIAKERLKGREYKGSVGLSFGLRYEPSDLSVRLTQVKVEQVELAGLPPFFQQALFNMGESMAQAALQDVPIHHFKPEDLKTTQRMGYEIGDIQVTPSGLAVHLKPTP